MISKKYGASNTSVYWFRRLLGEIILSDLLQLKINDGNDAYIYLQHIVPYFKHLPYELLPLFNYEKFV